MRRVERLLQLVRTIEDGQRHTSDSLAALFNVAPRTIYRDIKVLRQQGWRIPGGAGVGYVFMGRAKVKGYRIPIRQPEARI
ncbi:HTH domain-containing protein [Ochrobactrum sp. GPK 3]